jgi:hypothetical protein
MPVGLVAAVVGAWLLSERPAYAYIDPGTGSMIYQAALTALLGLGLVLRQSRESVSRFLKRITGRHAPSDPAE